VSSDNLKVANTEYQRGKQAFECGQYRQSVAALEKACALVNRNSPLGGEMQIWLVTAYQAIGQSQDAIALCRQLSKHPNGQTRQQGRRLLFILEAPKLEKRPEWLTQIPDLSNLEDSPIENRRGSNTPKRQHPPRRLQPEPERLDPSQIETEDDRFIWGSLGLAIVILAVLIGFSLKSPLS
jgi:tetratricopeptide (TPR) repeat protein